MGHPDGQNYAIWRGPDFNAAANFPLSNSNPFMAQGLITNFASLALNVAANVPNGITVVVQWFTDATETIPLGSMTWLVPTGYKLNVIVPAMGNFCTVAMTTSNVASVNCPLSVYPTNSSVGVTSYWNTGNFVQKVNQSIPANTTLQFNLPNVAEGSGYCMGIDPGSTGKLQLVVKAIDQSSSIQGIIAQINTLASPIVVNFIAPAMGVALTVLNTDVANPHACDFYIAIDGRI